MTYSFEKLLERYKEGEATAEEKSQVEEELAKAKALQDYLFEQEEVDDLYISAKDSESSFDFKKVQKKVKRKWMKQTITILTIVLSFILVFQLIVLPIIEKSYFDPTKNQTEQYMGDFELYQHVLGGTSSSSNVLEQVSSEKTGFAGYLIRAFSVDSFTGKNFMNTYQIIRNQLNLDNFNSSIQYLDRVDIPFSMYNPEFIEEDQGIENLKSLPESSWIKVAIFFKESLSGEELSNLVTGEQIKHVFNANVVGSAEGNLRGSVANIQFTNSINKIDDLRVNPEILKKYPELVYRSSLSVHTDPKILEQHVLSSYQFLIDYADSNPPNESSDNKSHEEKEASMLQENQTKDVLVYLKENGVKYSGITFAIKPNQINGLLKNQQISMIGVNETLLYAPHLDNNN